MTNYFNSLSRVFLILFFAGFLSACGSSNSGTVAQNPTASLPLDLAGRIVKIKFDFLSTGGSAPVNLNDTVRFTFSSSGLLLIDLNDDGTDDTQIQSFTVDNTGTIPAYVWADAASGFSYAVSLKTAGGLEINLFSNGAFQGQFETIVEDSAI